MLKISLNEKKNQVAPVTSFTYLIRNAITLKQKGKRVVIIRYAIPSKNKMHNIFDETQFPFTLVFITLFMTI